MNDFIAASTIELRGTSPHLSCLAGSHDSIGLSCHGNCIRGFWTVADLLRQRQAFWQLPTLVLVSEGGQGGRGGSYVRWTITATGRVCSSLMAAALIWA